jgi:hypothetical protein
VTLSVFKVDVAQLGPGGDAELGVDLVQVVADGVAADEQLVGDLLVAQPLAGQASDLPLLGGELLLGAGIALAGGLAAGPQLRAGPIGPGGGAEAFEIP